MMRAFLSICGVLIASACSQNIEPFSDPLTDAQAAVSKQDFTLLAFSNRAISLPGVDLAKVDLAMLEKHCGYRILPNSGDMLKPGEDLTQRKQMRAYATQYNQIVMEACLKKRNS